jgi:hypothetical protein
MSFNFTDKSYILGVCYQETMDGLINYLTAFWKEDGKWIGLQRKRIVKDDKIFDSNDEKIWTSLTPKRPDVTEDEIIEMIDLLHEFANIFGLKSDILLVQGNTEKFLELAKTKTWMHIKCEKIH